MREKIWKLVFVAVFVFWSALCVHAIIRTYNEGSYWECSFFVVAEYFLLDVTKEIVNAKTDKE